MKKYILLFLTAWTCSLHSGEVKYAAFAVDRNKGFSYGWAVDQPSREEAEKYAIKECNKNGANGSVVLVFSGNGAGAYWTTKSKDGNAYGWAMAATVEEADKMAYAECLKRCGNGVTPSNFVKGRNSPDSGDFKEIFNAPNEEISEEMKTVTIGAQIWTAENLDVSKFRNGDLIPEAKNRKEWFEMSKEGKPAYFYDDGLEKGAKYGKTYNRACIMDPRGLCPKGWRIPSAADWNRLIAYLGGVNVAATKMMTESGWDLHGSNSSGFSALAGGYEVFRSDKGNQSEWWSTSVLHHKFSDGTYKDYATVFQIRREGGHYVAKTSSRDLIDNGSYVRCIKE